MQKPSGMELALIFAIQILVGSGLFAIIALAAIGLNAGAHYLDRALDLDPFVMAIVRPVEILILCIDATLFTIYIFLEALRFVRDLLRSW